MTDQTAITKTRYAGNFIYEETGGVEELKFFNQPEGYVEPDGSNGYNYIYQYKDHLGNIRLSYTDANGDGDIDVTTDPNTNEIVEENNYYPFGLKHKGYNSNINGTHHKYMFGGKEYDESFQTLNTYDFGARNYDPALGRWMNIDPLAEQMRRHSPFNYAFNNPIYFIDPDGMAPTDWFVNKITGALTYIKGVSELNQQTASKAFGSTTSDVIFGSDDNQFENWENLGGDEMFDTADSKVSEESSREYKSSSGAEEFAEERSFSKATKSIVKTETLVAYDFDGAAGLPRETPSTFSEEVLDTGLTYTNQKDNSSEYLYGTTQRIDFGRIDTSVDEKIILNNEKKSNVDPLINVGFEIINLIIELTKK